MTEKHSTRGALLLLLGSVIWGAAFVAQRIGMDSVGPFWFNGIRMLLAGLVVMPVIALNDAKRKKAGREPEQTPAAVRKQRKAGLLCGVLLFAASSFQQVGLVSTGAGKAGFITALYVVMVPVAGWLLFRNNPGRIIWIGVALALAALYLLCMPAEAFRLESGDILLLACALCFTGQILCVDHYAPQVDAIRLSRDEFLVTGGLSLLVGLILEPISLRGVREALVPILYAGVMSGGIGYTLQIIGQRDVNPTVASLLMCLESVFAVLTGAVVLRERLTPRESWGCALMFFAVILAQLSPVLGQWARRRRRL